MVIECVVCAFAALATDRFFFNSSFTYDRLFPNSHTPLFLSQCLLMRPHFRKKFGGKSQRTRSHSSNSEKITKKKIQTQPSNELYKFHRTSSLWDYFAPARYRLDVFVGRHGNGLWMVNRRRTLSSIHLTLTKLKVTHFLISRCRYMPTCRRWITNQTVLR